MRRNITNGHVVQPRLVRLIWESHSTHQESTFGVRPVCTEDGLAYPYPGSLWMPLRSSDAGGYPLRCELYTAAHQMPLPLCGCVPRRIFLEPTLESSVAVPTNSITAYTRSVSPNVDQSDI